MLTLKHLDKRSVTLRGLLWMISTPYRIPAAQQKRTSTSPYFFASVLVKKAVDYVPCRIFLKGRWQSNTLRSSDLIYTNFGINCSFRESPRNWPGFVNINRSLTKSSVHNLRSVFVLQHHNPGRVQLPILLRSRSAQTNISFYSMKRSKF